MLSSLLIAALAAPPASASAPRPNILWLVGEDASVNWLGCYGHPHANTPHLDRLATQGIRFTHAYACAPVCAPSRSTWITGLHAVSTGTLPMRSRNTIPHDRIKYYPDYLRAAGYYTANHTKTDYNIGGRADTDCWNSTTATAWNECQPGQPFFQVINYMQSHESRAQGDVTRTQHSPNNVRLTRFHPDELIIRQNYAKYHDAVASMDAAVGKTLAALEESGHADNTIVIFSTDHGGVMPGSKRFLNNAGTHCPLMIRLPKNYTHLAPNLAPGSTVDRLVSFVDFPKTWLALTGAEVPDSMQGCIFFGPNAEPEPEFVYSYRDRMDERIDCQRAVRNKQFVYIKNYLPDVPNGQHLDYLWKLAATRGWEAAHRAGRTDAITGRFFQPKPAEELYDTAADPDNVVNLAARPEHAATLQTLCEALRAWQLRVHDSGLLPEAERGRRADQHNLTVFDLVRDAKLYDLPAYLEAADQALRATAADVPALLKLAASPDAGIRYWGVSGLAGLRSREAEVVAALRARLTDACGEVRGRAAGALLQTEPHPDDARDALRSLLTPRSPNTLFALNVLNWSGADLTPFREPLTTLSNAKIGDAEYERWLATHLLSRLGDE